MIARRVIRSVVPALAAVLTLSGLAGTAPAGAATGTGYYVTFAARSCASYSDIYANKARNDIVESLEDLGPGSQYGSSGAVVSPTYEDQAPQTNCKPLPDWRFTLGTGYVTRAVTGVWGSLSKVTGAYSTAVVTKSSTPLLDNQGNPVTPAKEIQGATTIELDAAQVAQASRSSSLWVQGGTPTDPVLAAQYGSTTSPEYGFGTLRCATDNVNGDNVEYVFFPSGVRHVFCYAYYVTPPPTSGTITITKRVTGAPAGADPAFPFTGPLSFDPTGFTLKNGQSSSFYRAGGETWTVTEGATADYRLTGISCTSTAASGAPGTSTYATSGATLAIGLVAGDHVSCTYTNAWVPPTGSLRITKITDGGTGRFGFDVATDAGTGGSTQTLTATTAEEGVPVDAAPALGTLAPGTYTITEHQPSSGTGTWKLSSVDCNVATRTSGDAVTVTVTRGTETSCTFTNTFTPHGRITLSKITEGGSGTTNFVVETTGEEPVQYLQRAVTRAPGERATATPLSAADATDRLPLGDYLVTEEPPLEGSGTWTLVAVVCDGVAMPFSQGTALVELARRDPAADCTFTNAFSPKPAPDPEPGEPADPRPPTPDPPATPLNPADPPIPANPENPPGPTTPEGPTPGLPGTPWADIGVSSRPTHPLLPSGSSVTDLVTVTNHGPGDAEQVVLDYQAVQGARLVSARPSRGSCTRRLPLRCSFGTLRPGQRITIRIVLRPTERDGLFRIREAVGSATYDPRLTNNAGYEHVEIERPVPRPPHPLVGPPS